MRDEDQDQDENLAILEFADFPSVPKRFLLPLTTFHHQALKYTLSTLRCYIRDRAESYNFTRVNTNNSVPASRQKAF